MAEAAGQSLVRRGRPAEYPEGHRSPGTAGRPGTTPAPCTAHSSQPLLLPCQQATCHCQWYGSEVGVKFLELIQGCQSIKTANIEEEKYKQFIILLYECFMYPQCKLIGVARCGSISVKSPDKLVALAATQIILSYLKFYLYYLIVPAALRSLRSEVKTKIF